jgi:hypothetical protein
MHRFFLLSLLTTLSLQASDVVLDTTTNLLWQDSAINGDASVTFKEASNYCKFLKIKEYQNFRLPTLSELQTIVDYKHSDPAILKGFKNISSTSYWTTTPYADADDEVWTINFEKGSRATKAIYYDRHFRCVQQLKK